MNIVTTLKSRWDARRAGVGKNTDTPIKDAGLALLDVLLGMAIFALIVVIAIQSVGQFRQRAFQTAVQSDAQQASIGIEGAFTDNQTYPAAGTAAGNINTAKTGVAAAQNATTFTALGVNLTKNVYVWNYTPNNAAGTYTLCLVHAPQTLPAAGTTALTNAEVDAYAVYDSSKGAITTSGRGVMPATAPAGC